MITPLVVQLCEETKLDLTPFLIALATSSNIGSVMTLVGNPQNMLVGIYSGWSYGGFFLRLLPVSLLGLWLNFVLIYFVVGEFKYGANYIKAYRISRRQRGRSFVILEIYCFLKKTLTDFSST